MPDRRSIQLPFPVEYSNNRNGGRKITGNVCGRKTTILSSSVFCLSTKPTIPTSTTHSRVSQVHSVSQQSNGFITVPVHIGTAPQHIGIPNIKCIFRLSMFSVVSKLKAGCHRHCFDRCKHCRCQSPSSSTSSLLSYKH